MKSTPIILPTSERVDGAAAIMPDVANPQLSGWFVVACTASNGVPMEFCQPSLSDVYIVSTDTARRNMYNRGNISLYWDGVTAMDEALQRSYQKLSEIRCLTDNWNGNGAPKFSDELLAAAKKIVETLSRQPDIFPTARESIQFEYENDLGDYLEFELFEGGRLKKFYCGHDGDTVTEDISIDTMDEVVRRFYGCGI